MIQITITANQVINDEPGKREDRNAYVKPRANYKRFVNDIFPYKVKNDPGKYSCHAIA
jgi:hypothetical protein